MGLDTVDVVKLQPVLVPPRPAKVLEAGPEPESVKALVMVKEPAVEPW